MNYSATNLCVVACQLTTNVIVKTDDVKQDFQTGMFDCAASIFLEKYCGIVIYRCVLQSTLLANYSHTRRVV